MIRLLGEDEWSAWACTCGCGVGCRQCCGHVYHAMTFECRPPKPYATLGLITSIREIFIIKSDTVASVKSNPRIRVPFQDKNESSKSHT